MNARNLTFPTTLQTRSLATTGTVMVLGVVVTVVVPAPRETEP